MSEQAKIIVVGAGVHGRVVADAARASGAVVLGYADEDPAKRGSVVCDLQVLATTLDEICQLGRDRRARVALGVGDNAARSRVYRELLDAGVEIATVVHPAAVLSSTARIGRGSVLFAGAIVNPGATIGEDVIVNTAATAGCDCRIGDHGHLSPGSHLGGTVEVGEGAHLGIGAVVRNRVVIGAWSVIGAGAVVVRDIPARVVAFGVPARVIRGISS